MALVSAPRIPVEELRDVSEELPYYTAKPFYQGSRARMDGDSIQGLVREWLEGQGFTEPEESLVFSWVLEDGKVYLTVVKHEARS